MKISEALKRVRCVRTSGGSPAVFRTTAGELADHCGARVEETGTEDMRRDEPGVIWLANGGRERKDAGWCERFGDVPGNAVCFQLRADGGGVIAPTAAHLLFGFVTYLLRDLLGEDVGKVADGRRFTAAFAWQRSTYDYFLTQEARIQRGLDRETYVRRLAEAGFTHLEVNGLASPMGMETGPKGEAYPMFYTYCPALDQFVSSKLNKGIYPHYQLSANLAYLKENVRLARKYGLVPGLLCFEPRSVPEEFFARYPMLRGGRVDHPFRSFKPRYNMTITHPLVREHYAEMVTKLLEEAPELGFLSVWTNDSGAGFEYTSSLYVGRNGGAYLIREWKSDDDIAKAAGENVVRFLRLLRDAGRKINPGFTVMTRMESFSREHDVVWSGLEEGVDVESASLVARGWEMPYHHPRYEESHAVNMGTVYQAEFDARESELAAELEARSSHPHFYFAAGPQAMFAPLLGVPYPTLTARRLGMLREGGVTRLAHLGGTCPPEAVPFNVNHEITRIFQFDAEADVEKAVNRIAERWAGLRFAGALCRAWKLAEEAILNYPNVTPLYSGFGFVWYRLWARPFVPDIEAIPPEERAYYQDFMCTTPHNPNNVDLSRDVLFELTTAAKCWVDLKRIDAYVWGPINEAIGTLDAIRVEACGALGERNVIEDQYVRLAALRCWFMTQRNVAAWVAGVHGYLEAEDIGERDSCRRLLRDMMEKEMDNSWELATLLDSGVEFMATTDQGETPLIHGGNLKELLEKRIGLMRSHMEDEPHIDPDYIERNAGRMLG